MSPALRRAFAAVATTAVVAALAGGFFLLRPPGEERLDRLDRARIAALSGISWAINRYYQRHGALPPRLESLAAEPDLGIDRTDPAGLPYEYRPLGGAAYALCATFQHPSAAQPGQGQVGQPYFWTHGVGRACFQFEAHNTPVRPD